MTPLDHTPPEMMAVAAARMLRDGDVCFVGIGLPSRACNLARLTHAPDIVLIYESGPIGARPDVLPLSIGDGELSLTADTTVSTPEIFRYWLQGGRVDIGFLGCAQIDRFANLNTTVIGPYDRPTVRLPGAGGAPEIAAHAKRTFIITTHGQKTFVEKLDFMTTGGFFEGGAARQRLGLPGQGPVAVITDLGILVPDPLSKELTLSALHPGVTVDQVRDATGWDLRVASHLTMTPPPDANELATLRDLMARTAKAHGDGR